MRNPKQISSLVFLLAAVFPLVLLLFAPLTPVQGGNVDPATAVCNFADAKQVSIRYVPSITKDAPRIGKLWTPDGHPILLFTETDLHVGNSDVASGAYSIYLVPDKDMWTLILNRNVASGAYDERQDLLRARMQTGELSEKNTQFTIYFGRIGPKACDMRVDYGKTRAWVEFAEK